MASGFASHFGITNIPYGIASSTLHPNPQAATRFEDTVIFLADLAEKGAFSSISSTLATNLTQTFRKPTLNSFAALPKSTHAEVRSTIQSAITSGSLDGCTEPLSAVTMHIPVRIGDFSDFSGSIHHMENMSEVMSRVRSLPPSFHKFPAVYAGRCSTIAVSGTPVTRPLGQFYASLPPTPDSEIQFGASRVLDHELEVGAIVGRPVEGGGRVLEAEDAEEHIFGLVLVNDWSARDIQVCEMNPLGPYNSKNFATSISPWVVTTEALAAFATPAPERTSGIKMARFLDDPNSSGYNIKLSVEIERNGARSKTCEVNFSSMYWTLKQMLAHHCVGGAGLRTGDLVASGTVSGMGEIEHGCLAELVMGGRKPFKLTDGSELRYLEDGDVVRFEGICGEGVGFGECTGKVRPALEFE